MSAQEVLMAYVSEHNRQNLPAVLDLFDENARFEISGLLARQGKIFIRGIEEWQTVLNSRIEIIDTQEDLNGIHFKIIVRNDCFRLAGLEEIRFSNCIINIKDGHITEFRLGLASESLNVILRILGAVIDWGWKERSDFLRQMLVGGEYPFNRESAYQTMILIQDWRKTSHIPIMVDQKPNIWNPVTRGLLALSVGFPTEEKITRISRLYYENSNWRMYGYPLGGRPVGLIGFELGVPGEAMVWHLAVIPAMRKKGIGRAMLDFAWNAFSLNKLMAESDRDAVGFFEKCGFVPKGQGISQTGRLRFRFEKN